MGEDHSRDGEYSFSDGWGDGIAEESGGVFDPGYRTADCGMDGTHGPVLEPHVTECIGNRCPDGISVEKELIDNFNAFLRGKWFFY